MGIAPHNRYLNRRYINALNDQFKSNPVWLLSGGKPFFKADGFRVEKCGFACCSINDLIPLG